MEKRKLKPQVKVALIIMMIIMGAILLECLINALVNVTEDIKTAREIKKEQEAYMETTEYKEEKYVEACVEEVITYLNSGDYESLYNVLDPEYKDYLEIASIDDFKAVLNTYIDGADSVKLLDATKQNERFICNVSLEKDGNIDTKRLLIKEIDESNFYVVLDDIYTIEKFNGRFRLMGDAIEYTLIYRVETGRDRTYIFDVKNCTNEDMVGSFNNSYLMTTDRKTSVPQNKNELKNITIPTGETVRVKFVIDSRTNKGYTFPDDMFYLNFDATDSSKSRKDTMILQWEYWE